MKKSTKIFVIIMGVLSVLLIIGAFVGDQSTSKSTKEQIKQKNESKVIEKNYERFSIKEILNDLEKNPIKLKEKLENKNIVFEGYINVIDSNGKYFTVTKSKNDIFGNIHIDIPNKEILEQFLKFDKGDKVQISGEVSRVGSIIGVFVTADKIQ